MSRTDERMAMLEGEMDNLRMTIAELEAENKELKLKLEEYQRPFIGLRLNAD